MFTCNSFFFFSYRYANFWTTFNILMQNTLLNLTQKHNIECIHLKIHLFLKWKQTKMLLNPFWSLTKTFSNRAMTQCVFHPLQHVSHSFWRRHGAEDHIWSVTHWLCRWKKKLLEADWCLSAHCSTLPLLQVKQVWRENKKGTTWKHSAFHEKKKSACVKLQLDFLSLQIKSTFCSVKRTVGEG